VKAEKSYTFFKNIMYLCVSVKKQPHGQAHLVFADTQANAENQKSLPFSTTTRIRYQEIIFIFVMY